MYTECMKRAQTINKKVSRNQKYVRDGSKQCTDKAIPTLSHITILAAISTAGIVLHKHPYILLYRDVYVGQCIGCCNDGLNLSMHALCTFLHFSRL